jgi:hypothetical protein
MQSWQTRWTQETLDMQTPSFSQTTYNVNFKLIIACRFLGPMCSHGGKTKMQILLEEHSVNLKQAIMNRYKMK